MKRWNKLVVFIVMVTLLGLGINVSPVSASPVTVSVPLYGQSPYQNLCWATSSSMIISKFNNDYTDRKVPIAQAKYGYSDFDKTAPTEDSRNAIYNYTGRYGTLSEDQLSWLGVKRQVDYGYPFYAYLNYISSAHAVVVKGYDEQEYDIIYNNPMSTGGVFQVDFDSFCSNPNYFWDRTLYYF